MKSSLKNSQLDLQEDPNICISKNPFFSCHISRIIPLNQIKVNNRMLPILPKKKQNPIRNRQLEALREKQNKMLAFYFHQKSLTCKNNEREAYRKMSMGNSRLKLQSEKSSIRNGRSINHYSFLQMKNTISEKTKYFQEGRCLELKDRNIVLS